MAEDDLTIFVLLNATGEILGLAPIKIKNCTTNKKTREIKDYSLVGNFSYNKVLFSNFYLHDGQSW